MKNWNLHEFTTAITLESAGVITQLCQFHGVIYESTSDSTKVIASGWLEPSGSIVLHTTSAGTLTISSASTGTVVVTPSGGTWTIDLTAEVI